MVYEGISVGLRLFGRCTSAAGAPTITGESSDFVQILRIEPRVIEYVARYRQLTGYSKEAGGQLFGTVSKQDVVVTRATGPYRGDERGRYSYRSNLKSAQRAIDKQAKKGLNYLGEWHTHAEDCPEESKMDIDAMTRLLRHSTLNVDPLLMLIVGRKSGPDGLCVITSGRSGVRHWSLVEATGLEETRP